MCRQRPGGDIPALTPLSRATSPPPLGLVGAAALAAVATILPIMAVGAGAGSAVAAVGSSSATADDAGVVRYLPPGSPMTVRSGEVALRYGLARRFELSLQVNNAFAAQNRRAVARAESLIAAIPGVRRVIGPSGLLAIRMDEGGRLSSSPLLAGGPGDDASEAVRQRLVRRSDAIGWFISRDGTEIRLLVETDDLPAVQTAIESTAASSGLVLLSGVAPASPLWPEPDRQPRPFPAWLPFLLIALALLPGALSVAVGCPPTIPRALLVILTGGLAAASPALLAPSAGIRHLAVWSGVGAALFLAAIVAISALASRRQGAAALIGMASARVRSATKRGRVPLAVFIPSVLLVVAAAASFPTMRFGTQLWRKTSVFFVEVRGDMNQPVVLRELRRLTDFLREEPGVAHAWSIADLFFAVPTAGDDFGGIPPVVEAVRSVLARARDDAAVRLELSADHRAALVGVRLDEESGVDRLTVLEHLEDYFQREHRSGLRRIDVSDPRVPAQLRGLGRGVLAADMRERVLRICDRSGRILSTSDVQTIERAARRAALVPVVEPVRLKAEIAFEVTRFFEQGGGGGGVAAATVGWSAPSERQPLVDGLAGQPADSTSADVARVLRVFWGKRLPEAHAPAMAAALHRRLAEVRRRHSARINYNDLLYGADLPTEGVLSEEVRDATLDAMGPIVGVPTVASAPGAFVVDAFAVGGAPSDRALSLAWLPLLMWGLLVSAAFTALVLAAIGGFAGLAWWPAALAPAAPLIIFPAVATLPVGVLYLAALSGALAGGAALAVAFAPGRRDQ